MPADPFGTELIYVPLKNHVPWIMDNKNLADQSRIEWGSKTDPEKADGSGNYWQMKDNSQVRMNAVTVKGTSYKDTCALDFAKAEKLGHIGVDDSWRDMEMTILVNLTDFSPTDGRVILKGPTHRHHSMTSSQPYCCSGACYGVRFFCMTNPMKVQFFKEIWHVNYESRPNNPISTKFDPMADGNDHYCKFVRYNIVENGKTAVKLEAYYNEDGLGKKFVKVAETIDSGGWGEDGGRCNGKDDQILSWGSIFALYRWDADDTDLKFKNASVYNVDPFASVDDIPNPPTGGGTGGAPRPTTQRLTIPIILSFDVNAYRFSSCAVGAGDPVAGDPFYSNEVGTAKPLTDNSSQDYRKRFVAIVVDTGSDWYNKKVKQFKAYLRKHNTPATNNVQAKIWKSGSGTTVLYTSPTVVTDAGLGTSFGLVTYDFSTNTYILKVGDRIGVEYLGNSSTNYVEASYVADISGNGTSLEQYEGSTWQRKTTREPSFYGYI